MFGLLCFGCCSLADVDVFWLLWVVVNVLVRCSVLTMLCAAMCFSNCSYVLLCVENILCGCFAVCCYVLLCVCDGCCCCCTFSYIKTQRFLYFLWFFFCCFMVRVFWLLFFQLFFRWCVLVVFWLLYFDCSILVVCCLLIVTFMLFFDCCILVVSLRLCCLGCCPLVVF